MLRTFLPTGHGQCLLPHCPSAQCICRYNSFKRTIIPSKYFDRLRWILFNIFSFSDGSRCWGPAECRGQGGGNLQQDGRQLGWKSDQVFIDENTFYKSYSFGLYSLVEGFQSFPHSFKARVCSMLRQRSEDGRPALPPVQNIAAYQFHKLKYS